MLSDGDFMATVEVDAATIERDVIKYFKTYAREYAKEASEQLTKKAKTCIEMFYNDYTPKYYDRTEDLKDNSVYSYFKNQGNDTYYGGVRISTDKMQPYYSGKDITDPLTVAQLGWHGFHGDPTGYSGRFEPIWTTSPLSVLTQFATSQQFFNSIDESASKMTLSQNYEVLEFE